MTNRMTTPAPSVAYAIALKSGHFGFQRAPLSATPGHLYLKVSDTLCLRSRYAPHERPEILIIRPQIDEFLRLSMRCHLWSPITLRGLEPVNTPWQLDLRDHMLSALGLYWHSRTWDDWGRSRFIASADPRVLNWLSRYRRDQWPELLSVEPGTGRAI